MKIGIQPDNSGDDSFSKKWLELLPKYGIEYKILDLLNIRDIKKGVEGCDGVMWRWLHTPKYKQSALNILKSIEIGLGIPTYPNSSTCWHFDDKVSQYYLLNSIGAPIVPTYVFWDLDDALLFGESTIFPLVAKLKSGAGSANVVLINDFSEFCDFAKKMFKRGIMPYTFNEFEKKSIGMRGYLARSKQVLRYFFFNSTPPLPPVFWMPEFGYLLVQRYIESDFDVRVTVIGNRAFGFSRRNRRGDFRASGSGLIDYNKQIDPRCIDIAFDISGKLKFQSMAYDFLIDKDGEPLLCEMSYTFNDRAVFNCDRFWNSDLESFNGHIWPQAAILDDFIHFINEKDTNSFR